MKQIIFSTVLSSVLFASSAAQAATCTGAIQGVSIEPSSGEVILERVALTTGGYVYWTRFCSVNPPANGSPAANGVPPDTCKSIYASLLAAQAQSRSITYYTSLSACTLHTQWQFVPGFTFFTVNG